MARVQRLPLSFSDAGRMILATEGSDIPVHRAISGQVGFDDVWLWLTNRHTADIVVAILWGSGASVDLLQVNAVALRTTLVIPGWSISNENLISVNCPASGGYTDPISVYGYINRFFQQFTQIG